MQIHFIEIQNFRKLKSVHVDLAKKTTLFVGANNSGKTSTMIALSRFLVHQNRFTTNDFTLSNWTHINKIGSAWEAHASEATPPSPTLDEWEFVLPSMDVWLRVADDEIHYVNHLLPTLDWTGGILGVRLRLEPKTIQDLYKEYLATRRAATETAKAAKEGAEKGEYTFALWPQTMRHFLEQRLQGQFQIRAYSLDPTKFKIPEGGKAIPQPLPNSSEPIDGDPFKGLLRIDEINAQRGFGDADNSSGRADGDAGQKRDKRKLSEQLRAYYVKHLDPSEFPEPSDLDALQAIDTAQKTFDDKLKSGFALALKEVEGLGYPGVTDPKLIISTKIQPTDGLDHSAAVQYEVITQGGEAVASNLRLPEEYNGLGYQNLISMVFMLMSFRDGWMQVGKAGKRDTEKSDEGVFLPPLHLVLVEEPEAHLHAQVQQVFIRKAYDILRAHDDLGEKTNLTTQLIVSTHSSHIAHECEYATLRYFRRLPAMAAGEVPTSTVVNLSEVFGTEDDTKKFVTRYLRAAHSDLFFADAAILVEGPAERMLVPHFIREHFQGLNQCYITLLEIGGSHAHRLRSLIESLGLTTLIVTDLDAADPAGKHPAQQPVKGQSQITGNSTLKGWVPEREAIDELLVATKGDKERKYDQFFSVRVAYQCPVNVRLKDGGAPEEALSNTFEDALVFENVPIFKDLDGSGLINKFKEALSEHKTTAAVGQAMFDALQTGNKAEFALNLLYLQEPKNLKVPRYIDEGLSWLQNQLKTKQMEILTPVIPVAATTAEVEK
jgi:predicted ATP-dependent endonuclease of OLD family